METSYLYRREPECLASWKQQSERILYSIERKGVPLPTEFVPIYDLRILCDGPGVYIALAGTPEVPRCIYVGQAKNIRTRLRPGRSEFEGVEWMAIVRCQPHELLRVEAFYVGMLNPENNAAGEEYQKRSLKGQEDASTRRPAVICRHSHERI
jgi:hypothetical protein